jgi:hypothetical protein
MRCIIIIVKNTTNLVLRAAAGDAFSERERVRRHERYKNILRRKKTSDAPTPAEAAAAATQLNLYFAARRLIESPWK